MTYLISVFLVYTKLETVSVNLLDDDAWLEMLKLRNELAHDYDEVIIKNACQKIISTYLDLFYEFRKTVDALLKEQA